jgi:DNA helicase-2/ATP-dependent DNA helicase PcrA
MGLDHALMGRGSIFEGLNPGQREAVETTEGPLLILAGAGTGKTRTVICRMANLLRKGVLPSQILAVTFTNKAANEMRERVGGMVSKKAAREMTVCTFHSLCVRILREHIGLLGYKANFSIAVGGDREGLIKQLIIKHGGAKEKIKPGDISAAISSCKNSGLSFDEIQDDLIRGIAYAYQTELRARNALDFDDLLVLGERLLREHGEAKKFWSDRFRYITVDEFQDTNGLQMDMLRELVGAPYHVCVVGDDDQSIYSWRGAEVANILEFERFFPNPAVALLEENYRSTEAILEVANSLIKHSPRRREKALRPTIMGGEKVQLMGLPGDDEEALWVSGEIKGAVTKGATGSKGVLTGATPPVWEDFAVLFRTNMQIRRMEQAMREEEIPYRLIGAQSFFDKREIRDLLAYLQVAANPEADVALLRILNSPPRGIGTGTSTLLLEHSREKGTSVWAAMWDESFVSSLSNKAGGSVRTFAGQLEKLQEKMKGAILERPGHFQKFLEEIEYVDWLMRNSKGDGEKDKRREAVGELILAFEEAGKKGKSVQKFLDDSSLDSERDDQDIEKKSGVTLITLHASKGLEYPVVYLVGLEDGILPHKRSMEEGTRDEERRLLYVGITRAQKRLILSFCRARKRYGEQVLCQPSSFIPELNFEWIEQNDYVEMMNEEVSADDLKSSLGGLRAMLE